VTAHRYAVVAGGGTGGHVLPALAVARALVGLGHRRQDIELVGSRRGQEDALLAEEGFPVTLLAGRGLSRRLGARDLWANVGALVAAGWSLLAALRRVARWRPAVVVSVGGYASFPAGAAAVLLGVPLVLVNVDAVPGLVHRLLGRFAASSTVAYPGTPAPRAVLTGTPVREEIAAVDRSVEGRRTARRALGLPEDRPTVAAFGGSLGARRVNLAVAELATRWATRPDRSIFHVLGRRGWEETPPAEVNGGLCYRAVPFESQMGLLYGAADVVVCRAGAITVAELAVAGVPAVLVPLPGAPGDHQNANAAALAEAGAAVVLADAEASGARLSEILAGLLNDPTRLDVMGEAARSLGRPDAAARVARVVEASAH
jgi:undecaprenyldiphospho-muramoylpentapeptide beta-N-acetylglucosaminyltransferase